MTNKVPNVIAKTPWSWGRMDDILSEGREIESRRQLKAIINQTNWKRKQARPRTTIDARALEQT